ncbi:MAG: O-antigen ligase family protein [Gammaproteobacteria bacterium]|nr:O-antigen ligase family protein [Gammaproteobacteria bacterium]
MAQAENRWDRLALWLTLGLTLVAALHPALRHAKYLPLAVLPFFFLFKLKESRKVSVPYALYPYLLLLGAGLALFWQNTGGGWKDLAFIAAYVLPFVLFRPVRLPMAGVNLAVFGVYLAATLMYGQYQLNFSWVKSATFAESPMSFVAGLFLIYWLTRPKDKTAWLMLALNLIFMLLSMKRAAFLGVLAAGAVLLMPELWRRYVLHPLTMTAFNLALLSGFLLLGAGYFDAYAAQHGVVLRCAPGAANCFDATNGRLALIQDVAAAMLDQPWAFILGEGVGSGYAMMKSVAVQGGNLHNDLVKIAYEFGLLVFAAFSWLLYRARSPLALASAVYLNVVFCFDNVLIYTGVMVFFGLLLGQARVREPASVGPTSVGQKGEASTSVGQEGEASTSVGQGPESPTEVGPTGESGKRGTSM